MKTPILTLAFLLLISVSCKKDKPSAYPLDGLISYFNFNDHLKDQQGYAKDGVGTATFGAGKVGKAAVFNGTDQKITFSPVTAQSNNHISIAFWFKNVGTTPDLIFLTLPDVRIGTSNQDADVNFNLLATGIGGSIITSQWTHIVGTWDGTKMSIYVNGVLKNSKSSIGTIVGFNADLVLGVNSNNYWAGSIDELFIYNRAITEAEVTQLYNLK